MTYEEAKAEVIRRSHEEWSRTRLRGRRRFILVHGIILTGGLMALSFSLGQFLGGMLLPVVALFNVIACLTFGYLVGISRWKHNEDVYRSGREEEIG